MLCRRHDHGYYLAATLYLYLCICITSPLIVNAFSLWDVHRHVLHQPHASINSRQHNKYTSTYSFSTLGRHLRPDMSNLHRRHHEYGYVHFATRHDGEIHEDILINNDGTDFVMFQKCLEDMKLPQQKMTEIMNDITEIMGFTSSSELYVLSLDFVDRPEVLSSVLRSDFGLSVGKSHLIRGALMRLVNVMANESSNGKNQIDGTSREIADKASSRKNEGHATSQSLPKTFDTMNNSIIGPSQAVDSDDTIEKVKRPLFKSVIVNQRQKQRHMNSNSNGSSNSKTNNNNYGLPSNYKELYPKLSQELDDFLKFMTKPSAAYNTQESPIRKTTATVYIRHAKLFMGWYINVHTLERGLNQFAMSSGKDEVDVTVGKIDVASISIQDIIPDREPKSAQPVVDFILWLRNSRQISDSYEANMLRGLTKLLKYRFREESKADPSYGEKSFGDIPVVRELRKLHRDANRRQVLSPRSSEEDRKWLDWEEYLNVVRLLKEDLQEEIRLFESNMEIKDTCKYPMNNGTNGSRNIHYTPTHRRIATKFQAYLILAFFSCVPDRQRTFRELEVGKSFIRDERINVWTIKHGPDDYKTGKTYGDRPPLVLAEELTPAIDDFLARWRPCLLPLGQSFFVQPRTGKAFTQDSVYSLVARSCYKHTGKKTNPHLLRDMIVTHVRDSDASEKELEALALYMGHSISMQRNSYDRRTMEQKVAPAVELLRNVNTSGKE